MIKRPSKHEWPMETYLEAWTVFRQLSNENSAIAAHLVSRDGWPKRGPINVVDIGCGDGLLLEQIVIQSPTPLKSAHLIDPDGALLKKAEASICATRLVPEIRLSHAGFESVFPECLRGGDVGLLIHVVYLLDIEVACDRLAEYELDQPLYVVFDAPDSVFTTLWSRTAKKYHVRTERVRNCISQLPIERFTVNESRIKATICNPLAVRRPDVKNLLLSILTYSDVDDTTDPDMRGWVEKTIDSRAVGDLLPCESICYEIWGKPGRGNI